MISTYQQDLEEFGQVAFEMRAVKYSRGTNYEKNCIDGSNFHEQVVNSRELWTALEVKTEYSHWAKRRLEDVDAEENLDYLTGVKKDGRQTLIDYITPQQLREVIKYESIIQGLLQLGQDYQGVKAILENPAAFLPEKSA